MRLRFSITVAVTLTLLFPMALFAANPKAGSTCSKLGSKQTYAGKKFTCVKSGKKLIWDKGVSIKVVPKPSPSSSPTPSATPSATPSSTPTSTPSPITYIETANLASVENCKIKDARVSRTNPNNVGFPLSPDLLPASGVLRIIVAPVDFSDAVGDSRNLDIIESQISALKNWFNFVSNNKISVEVQYVRKWFRAYSPSTSYQSDTPQINGPVNPLIVWDKYAQEFIDITGNNFDFSKTDAIIWHFPDYQRTNINNEILGRGSVLKTPIGPKPMFYWASGNVLYDWEKRNGTKTPDFWAALWVHELLHSMGLALHAPGNGFESGVGQNQSGASWILDAWETFKMGWIADDQVFCAPISAISESVIFLQPLETKSDGYKIAVMPIDSTKAIVIESRRPVGYSNSWDPTMEGIYIYILDTTLDNDRSKESTGDSGNDPDIAKWAFYLPPDGSSVNPKVASQNLYKQYLFKVGQKLTYKGIEISYLQKNSKDVVQFKKL